MNKKKLFLFGDNDAYSVCQDGVYRFNNPMTTTLPSKPVLVIPSPDAKVKYLRTEVPSVTFEWEKTTSTDYYEIIIGDSTFQKISRFYTKLKDNRIVVQISDSINYWKVRAVNGYGKGAWSDVRRFMTGVINADSKENNLTKETKLFQNYPNPFNSSTAIKYCLSEKTFVKMAIYDCLGRELCVPVNEIQEEGFHSVNWNAKNVSSGIYYIKFTSGNFQTVKKMTYVR